MTNDEMFLQEPLFLTKTEDGQIVPVVPLGADFYLSLDFLREHGDQVLTMHGGPGLPIWEAGFVSDNSQALRIYFQLPNVPDDVSKWGQTLYKVGLYFVYKIYDDKGRLVYRRLEPDRGFSAFFLIAAAVLTAGAAAAIGGAVIGAEMAAAYPALASAVGNAVIGTALSGGDVENAVKGAALSFVGGQVGQYVGSGVSSLTNVDLMGKVAGNVAATAVKGGNLVMGAITPLASEGASYAVDFVSDAFNSQPAIETPVSLPPVTYQAPSFAIPGGSMDENYFDVVNSFDGESGASYLDFDWESDALNFGDVETGEYFAATGGGGFIPGGFDTPSHGVYTDPDFVDHMTFDPNASGIWTPVGVDVGDLPSVSDVPVFDFGQYGAGPVTGNTGIVPPGPTGNFPSGGGSGGTDWAAAAVKLGTLAVQVWQAQGRQPVRTVSTTQTRLPDGSVQTISKDGTVITQSPTGQITRSQIPPGAPVQFPDGSTVMNNGNGTYSVMTSNGQVRTGQYGASGGLSNFMSGNTPLYIGGALLAVMFLRGRR